MVASLAAVALISTGCGGVERKLGRGINNSTEFLRLGEMRRAVEQSALWEGGDVAYTTGVIRGFTRSMARTIVGFSEVLTFPFPTPTYDPYFFPAEWFWDPYTRVQAEAFSVNPSYPDNYRPHLLADQTFATDSNIGFSGGDVIPWLPGSRFRVFDY